MAPIAARGYWTRIWTLQEIHAAQRIRSFCGSAPDSSLEALHKSLYLSRIEDFDLLILDMVMHISFHEPVGHLYWKHNSRWKSQREHIQFFLIQAKVAAEPLDKIYAIRDLGFAALRRIEVDYSQDPYDIYWQVTKACMESYDDALLMWETGAFIGHSSRVPSWVIDFSQTSRITYFKDVDYKVLTNATSLFRRQLDLMTHPDHVVVSGIFIDSVRATLNRGHAPLAAMQP